MADSVVERVVACMVPSPRYDDEEEIPADTATGG
jgi:hypothetical protein